MNPNDMVTSLREALADACAAGAGNHTITFGAAQQGGTITLDQAEGSLDIYKNVPGAVNLSITAGSAGVTIQRSVTALPHQLMSNAAGVNLSLTNLTFQNGLWSTGGAMTSSGNLSLLGCAFVNNFASTHSGGALIFSGDTLYVAASTFTNNWALAGDGGAIALTSHVGYAGISYSTFSENKALFGGALSVMGGTTTPTTIDIAYTTMFNNEASNAGGAIAVNSFNTGANVTFLSTTLADNRVVNADPQFQTKGGGVYFGKGTLTATSLTLSNNDAKKGDGLYLVVPGSTLVGVPVYINDSKEEGPA